MIFGKKIKEFILEQDTLQCQLVVALEINAPMFKIELGAIPTKCSQVTIFVNVLHMGEDELTIWLANKMFSVSDKEEHQLKRKH